MRIGPGAPQREKQETQLAELRQYKPRVEYIFTMSHIFTLSVKRCPYNVRNYRFFTHPSPPPNTVKLRMSRQRDARNRSPIGPGMESPGGGRERCSMRSAFQAAAPTNMKDRRTPVYPDPDDRTQVRRVALVAIDLLDRDAFCYALNTCQRMDAHLDVLTNLSQDEANHAIFGARGTADTPWQIIRISGECGDAVYR